jgi:tRNA threonylcarbamoyladenosine biosynthesis protein TsaE
LERIANNVGETHEFGLELGKRAKAGDVIALIGDLGTGKTALAKAIAEGLGITAVVASPTFAIIHEHGGGRLPLYHFDVYRLSGPDDMYELGFEDYFYGGGLTVVEWADRVMGLLPPGATVIRISRAPGGGEGRIFTY